MPVLVMDKDSRFVSVHPGLKVAVSSAIIVVTEVDGMRLSRPLRGEGDMVPRSIAEDLGGCGQTEFLMMAFIAIHAVGQRSKEAIAVIQHVHHLQVERQNVSLQLLQLRQC